MTSEMASVDFRKAPLEQLKSMLKQQFSYLHLVVNIEPRLKQHPGVLDSLHAFGEFIDTASEQQIRSRGTVLSKRYQLIVDEANTMLGPKKPWQLIAFEFWELNRTQAISWKTGLEFAWFAERFSNPVPGLPPDFPYHGRIGIGPHTGFDAVEEIQLLLDAFFFLVKARRALEHLETYGSLQHDQRLSDRQAYLRLSALNQTVAAYSRVAVLTFYSFVECFVNSVAEDYIRRNPELDSRQQEYLRGLDKGRTLTIEKRIETYPGIIRGDYSRPIVISDPAQRKEPYVSFVGQAREVRDAATHFSKRKAGIWRPPQEWAEIANASADTCLGVAQGFWSACYPSRPFPRYLMGLDPKAHLDAADSRIDIEIKVSSMPCGDQ